MFKKIIIILSILILIYGCAPKEKEIAYPTTVSIAKNFLPDIEKLGFLQNVTRKALCLQIWRYQEFLKLIMKNISANMGATAMAKVESLWLL